MDLQDLEEIEEWNEYGELKEALGATSTPAAAPVKSTSTATTSTPPPKLESRKENEPSATSEQNLAIRQLGAEAAKVAASKKAIPGNITTTNPLLAEKVNSPAASTPKKAEGDKGGILSPRSIPLPSTPSVAESVKSPTGTVKSPTSPPGQLHRSHSGAEVQDASEEEIKRIEKEQAIAEVSSSEEEDDEDEKKLVSKAASASGASKAEPSTKAVVKPTEEEEHEDEDEEDDEEDDEDDDDDDEEEDVKLQKQDPKSAEKAGQSVKD